MASEKKPEGEQKKKAPASESGERKRGPSEYARKEGDRPKPRAKTRFVFKFAALILVLLATWIGWILYTSGGDARDLLDENKRAAVLDKMTDQTDVVRQWAEREFKDWEKELTKRLKSPPPKTKEESAALVKETKKELQAPTTPPTPPSVPSDSKPAGTAEQKAPVQPPKTNPSLAKAIDEYNHGMQDYAMTDPAASQAQVQKYVHLAAARFESCLYWLDKARAEGVSENLIERYEQPATKRLYDCRKRMELQMR